MSRFRLALAALLLGCLAVPTNAEDIPNVVLSSVDPGSTDITNLDPFTRTGNFLEVFHNALGTKMTDFHICFELPATQNVTADGDGIFNQVIIERDGTQVCVTFQGQPGVPNGGYFGLQTSGFADATVFTIRATIPEPSSVLLGATGFVGLGLIGRSRRRARV